MLAFAPAASADESASRVPLEGGTPGPRTSVPVGTFTFTAYGAPAHTYGLKAYALGRSSPGQTPIAGGGISGWWSPIDRATLIGDASRNALGELTPSAAVVVRILGRPGDGWSLGGLAKMKLEGFGDEARKEIEGELEGGLLTSYARGGWHLDLNAIAGAGLGDEGEADAEGRARLGHDLGSFTRLGFDTQARFRIAGDKRLPGDRTWDFAAGPEAVFAFGRMYGSLFTGATSSTVPGVQRLGWLSVVSLGGVTN
ncbi:MAG: hypothetical protein JWM74_923 [Myxococcaceae bacterium]|nr:hypothetical protein [Myxococcaceae bacterium]